MIQLLVKIDITSDKMIDLNEAKDAAREDIFTYVSYVVKWDIESMNVTKNLIVTFTTSTIKAALATQPCEKLKTSELNHKHTTPICPPCWKLCPPYFNTLIITPLIT